MPGRIVPTRNTRSTTATGWTRSASACATRTTTRPRARPDTAGARSARTGPVDPRYSVQQDVPFVQQDYSNWFHGGTAPSGFLFPDTSFFRNYQTWSEQVVASVHRTRREERLLRWVPWDGDYSTKFPANDGLGVNPQNQQTTAAYAQLSFKHDKWDGNVGVRFVKTEASGIGPARVLARKLRARHDRRRRCVRQRRVRRDLGQQQLRRRAAELQPALQGHGQFLPAIRGGEGHRASGFPQLLPSITDQRRRWV